MLCHLLSEMMSNAVFALGADLMQEERRTSDSKLGAELSTVRQDLSKAHGDKARAEDSMRQLQALQDSLQRQLDEVAQQLQQEQLRSADLEAQVTKIQMKMQVRLWPVEHCGCTRGWYDMFAHRSVGCAHVTCDNDHRFRHTDCFALYVPQCLEPAMC